MSKCMRTDRFLTVLENIHQVSERFGKTEWANNRPLSGTRVKLRFVKTDQDGTKQMFKLMLW